MDRDILALTCPDWRGAALVLDCATLQVLYANWSCLELAHRGELLRISAGGVTFVAENTDRRIRALLSALQGTDIESAIVIEAGVAPEPSYSIAIRRPQGLLGEALSRHTLRHGDLAVLEFASSDRLPGNESLQAFAEAFQLSGDEMHFIAQLLESRGDPTSHGAGSWAALRCTTLAKLGCRSSNEAIRLVMSLCPTDVHHGLPATAAMSSNHRRDGADWADT